MKFRVIFSKKEWINIGKQAGWFGGNGSDSDNMACQSGARSGGIMHTATLTRKVNPHTNKKEWCLVSREKHRVLEWYGTQKPSKETVEKSERRVS